MWLVHPKPQNGELFSSWLIRCANAHGWSLHSFCHHHWPGLQIWTRDIDHLAPIFLVDSLARHTGTSPMRAHATTLRAFEGCVFTELKMNANTALIAPIGIHHRERKGFGLRYCPCCLRDDPVPHFKKQWRLTFISSCTKHGVELLDSCSQCQKPIAPHRGEFLACHHCSFDLREAEAFPATSTLLQFQKHTERVLEGHPVVWPNFTGLHPLSFFALINRLLPLLACGPRRNALHQQMFKMGLNMKEPDFNGPFKAVQFLTVRSVANLMEAATYLLRGWPWMFVGLCRDARLSYSWVMRDCRPTDAPYVLLDPTIRYLKDQN
jgi:TniQ